MIDYKSAGVNIDTGNAIVDNIKTKIQKTYGPEVLTELGGFAGMVDLKMLSQGYEHPVLVQSIDGLGTKPAVAVLANRYDGLGLDLLSATANDILVTGATPLTLLDYVASAKLDPTIITTIVNSLADACKTHGVSLVGGETAEMPGTYQPQEVDVVGIITGIVEKSKIINGSTINVGDRIYGIASSGLHTNGYSLARKLIFDVAKKTVHDTLPGTTQTFADALLASHIYYGDLVHSLLNNGVLIHGMAHITGGGLLENVPRVLPSHCNAFIDVMSWPLSPLFSYLTEISELPDNELYRTFNMGIGYVFVVPKSASDAFESIASQFPAFQYYTIGEIIPGNQSVVLTS